MRHRNFVREYLSSLFDRQLMPTAFKVALFIGSLLFAINHAWALLTGHMTSERWISGGLTYIVPYMVSIHGQYIGRKGLLQKM
ncbi:nitrate/nitrite transporter NrtS [Dendronalium sp. ChiSLP03b]|uniref:nitrate/nitrite transporter NrtS n=1 Tax=Dendronalium sp. ChiSLP03b TaxID=3075381 RepID=UPI002AD5AD83|nr:nitrate/nitrite transporter NrtS [Dendronalium sp. ChiSLP03b]MDZ8207484.1 nitrate/nitrite transporter NrtS [Dendronalium sp. ChiSLP03b]